MDSPKWTDVVIAIAAIIAVPGAIAGFILLFKKDKNKQEQIDKLVDIATKIDAQNTILQEGNNLTSEQVNVLRGIAFSQMEASEGSMKLADLEKQKYLLSIRPRLFLNGGKRSGSEIRFFIENFGEDAFIKNVKDIHEPPQLIIRSEFGTKYEFKKDSYINIVTNRSDGNVYGAPSLEFRILIEYEDKAGNLYQQIISGDSTMRSTITDPELVQYKAN